MLGKIDFSCCQYGTDAGKNRIIRPVDGILETMIVNQIPAAVSRSCAVSSLYLTRSFNSPALLCYVAVITGRILVFPELCQRYHSSLCDNIIL